MSLWAVLQVLGQLGQLYRIEPGFSTCRHSRQTLLPLSSYDFGPLMHRLSFNAQLPCNLGLAHAVF
jgi:hypothetical protein